MYLLHELKHKQDSKTDDSFGNLYDRLFELRDELQSKLNDLQGRIEELRQRKPGYSEFKEDGQQNDFPKTQTF